MSKSKLLHVDVLDKVDAFCFYLQFHSLSVSVSSLSQCSVLMFVLAVCSLSTEHVVHATVLK